MPTIADDMVADSTDWLATPLACLTAVESALRCQVCKDFYETPMITSCSHTFCSLCIRRALSNDNKCPLCRAGDQEMKLRSNWAVEEAVEAFKKARGTVLDLARNPPARPSPKRSFDEVDAPGREAGPSPKKLRTSTRLSRNRSQMSMPAAVAEEEEVVQASDEDDEEFVPEPDDGLVACPMCQRRMKEYQVFTHLEKCPGPVSSTSQRPKNSAAPQVGSLQRQQNDRAAERLPTLSYAMFKEGALRKKMQDLGISSQGPRHLLERRHREWITIWNANCDAARPKKRHQLLQDLDIWEKTQGGRAPSTGKAVQNAAIIKDKDFDGAAWAAQHDSSFKDLIANARKSRLEAKKNSEEKAKEESKSDEPRIERSAELEANSTPQQQPPQPDDSLQEPREQSQHAHTYPQEPHTYNDVNGAMLDRAQEMYPVHTKASPAESHNPPEQTHPMALEQAAGVWIYPQHADHGQSGAN